MLYMEHTTCWDLANVPYMGYWPRPERVKKKKVLSQKQLDVLANARIKLKAKNSERTTKKKLEADAIESEIQSR